MERKKKVSGIRGNYDKRNEGKEERKMKQRWREEEIVKNEGKKEGQMKQRWRGKEIMMKEAINEGKIKQLRRARMKEEIVMKEEKKKK